MDNNIIQLQELVAHQGEDIARLSDELYTQQKQMLRLQRQVAELTTKLKSAMEDGSGIKPPEEETPPPHY